MQRRTFQKAALLCLLAPTVALAKGKKPLPIKLEMKASQVLKLLGPPAKKGKEVLEQATGDLVQEWSYPAQGLTLAMAHAKKTDPAAVAAITAVSPCPFVSETGVGIGDEAEKVKAAYKGKIDSASSDEGTIVVGSVYGGIVFTLKGGKVSRIFWGAAAE